MSRVSSYNVSTKQGEILTFPVTLSDYSAGVIPMVFEHSVPGVCGLRSDTRRAGRAGRV